MDTASSASLSPLRHQQAGPVAGRRVLCVARDEEPVADLLRWLREAGAEPEHVADAPDAARRLWEGRWDAVLVQLGVQAEDEVAWWAETARAASGTPRLVVLTARPSVGLVVRAARLGVLGVLTIPVRQDELMQTLSRAVAAAEEVRLPLPPTAGHAAMEHELVGESPAMLAVYSLIARAAPTPSTILVLGESGTGKELVARTIHRLSPRSAASFVAVNCAAIPEHLLESELFGHEKGAFTGAVAQKIGRFERASGGTLFLDEVADMSLVLQSKILRAVQEREIERVGGGAPIPVDVRLLAATNIDLRDAVKDRRFREDLYYRLAVVTLLLPPLRQRGDDLLLLTTRFLREFGRRAGKEFHHVSDTALAALRRHKWPGNVRELRNVIERAVVIAEDDMLRVDDLPEELRGAPDAVLPKTPGTLATLSEVEAHHIATVLTYTLGQIGEASRILGLHRNTLARKIREYGL